MQPDEMQPDETDPVIRNLREMRESMRRIATATVLLLVVFVVSFAAALYIRSNDLEQQNNRLQNQNHLLRLQDIRLQAQAAELEKISGENRQALLLLCSTEESFDNVLLTAANQIRESFQNGTYARLLKQGIITQANLDAAHKTEASYRATHEKLKNPVACDRISEETEP